MRRLLFILTAATLILAPVCGQETKPDAGGMDPKMMEAWMKIAAPGPMHEHFKAWTGTWDTEITMWMAPGAPPQQSKGTAVNKLLLGGRFLYSENTGIMMGMPFEGIGISGYDNFRKEFVNIWMDNMGTAIYEMRGQLDASGKVETDTGVWDDPMTGGKIKVRSVTTIENQDRIVMVMYQTPEGGQEFKSMEMRYTRRK